MHIVEVRCIHVSSFFEISLACIVCENVNILSLALCTYLVEVSLDQEHRQSIARRGLLRYGFELRSVCGAFSSSAQCRLIIRVALCIQLH